MTISQEERSDIRTRAHARGYYTDVSRLLDALEQAEQERDEQVAHGLKLAEELDEAGDALIRSHAREERLREALERIEQLSGITDASHWVYEIAHAFLLETFPPLERPDCQDCEYNPETAKLREALERIAEAEHIPGKTAQHIARAALEKTEVAVS
jgi:hypothetical protein